MGLLALFFLAVNGLSVPPEKEPRQETTGPVMSPSVHPADFDSLLTAEKKKLHPQVLGEIEAMEQSVQLAENDSLRSLAYETVAKKWLGIQRPVVAAFYFSQSGFLDNSEKKLTFASHLMNEGLHEEQNPAMRQWMADVAERSLNKILEKDPTNVEAKMELATLYIEGKAQPMQGVAQLQDIVRNDSSNFQANLVLGKMAIESNQLDRAIERANLLIRFHPDSWEARILMAEAYARKGDREQAVRYLSEAKKFNNDPGFGKDVDEYIEKIQ